MAKIKRGGLTFETINTTVSSIMTGKKTDREMAILGGAILEGILFDFLKDRVIDSKYQKRESLFEFPRPLSSFGSMNSLALAFGVISETEFHLISIVKKVRDYAAHSIGLGDGVFSFNDKSIREILLSVDARSALDYVRPKDREETIAALKSAPVKNAAMAYAWIFNLAETRLLSRVGRGTKIAPPFEFDWSSVRSKES